MSATIKLPWPPSANHYWERRIVLPRAWGVAVQAIVGRKAWPRLARNFIGAGLWPIAQTFIGSKGKAFRADVQAAIINRFGRLKPLDCRLAIHVTAMMPDRRVRDLSNLLKATEDALTHADVWTDDGLIDRITIERGPVCKPGALLVTIEAGPTAEPAIIASS